MASAPEETIAGLGVGVGVGVGARVERGTLPSPPTNPYQPSPTPTPAPSLLERHRRTYHEDDLRVEQVLGVGAGVTVRDTVRCNVRGKGYG